MEASKPTPDPSQEGNRSAGPRLDAPLLGGVEGGLSVLLLSVLSFGRTLGAAEPTKVQLDSFENKIRPIFAGTCYKCHSPAEGKIKGGLELDWKGG
jgi:hypothetical protein